MPAAKQDRQQIDDRAAAHIQGQDQQIGDNVGGSDHQQREHDAAQFAPNRIKSEQAHLSRPAAAAAM